MRITVVGSGYVGLVAAACFAELGHNVVSVDNDSRKIAALNAGEALIHEEYLPDLLRRHRGGRLLFSSDLPRAVHLSEVVMIAVGTPPAANGEADVSYVETVTREIAAALNEYKVIVEKSTVPVRTNSWIRRAMIFNGCISDFDVVSNPEFLREGTAVTDFLYPDRIVVGLRSKKAACVMKELYAPLLDGSYGRRENAIHQPECASNVPFYLETTPETAELIKHASNAFLATRISFINAVSMIAESVGADIEDVRKGMGTDKRIGSRFLSAGIGYGGSCFPKDVSAFQSIAIACGFEFKLLEAVRCLNDEQVKRFVAKVHNALWTIKNKRLAVLGLAFKSGTDDIRESPAIHIIKMLLQEGGKITAFDPAAMDRARSELGDCIHYATDAYSAMQGAEALLILTEWSEFRTLDLSRVNGLLKYPVVIDGRNLYSPEDMARAGLNYYSFGRRAVELVRPISEETKVSIPS